MSTSIPAVTEAATVEQVDSIWYTRCPVPTATGIALDHGWLNDAFQAQDIDLVSIRDHEDPTRRASHFNHQGFGLFREGGNIPAIWARARGESTVVVGLTWVDEAQFLLARPQSGIRNEQDLKGKKLGLTRRPGETIDFVRAMALHGFASALQVGGGTLDDVQIVDIDAPAVEFRRAEPDRPWRDPTFDALLAGEIDVAYIKGAAAIALREAYSLTVVADLNTYLDPALRINNGTPRPVTVDRAFASQQPQLVARYLSVLLRASEWAKAHARDVFRIVAAETSTTPQDVERAYGARLPWSLGITLDAERVAALTAQKNFLLTHGFLAGDFSVEEWIDPVPLALARKLHAAGQS